MHGREPRFPLETSKAKPSVSPDIQTTTERLQRVREYPVAKANIDSSQEKQKEQYKKEKGIWRINFQVGDVVLRMNMLQRSKKGHKMEDSWLGPYKNSGDKQSWLLQTSVLKNVIYFGKEDQQLPTEVVSTGMYTLLVTFI